MEIRAQSVSSVKPDVFRIGEWTFCASDFHLERGQEIIKLEPRVAQLLANLAANAGKTVSRETLMEEVWPGVVVGDEALSNAINKLRKAFGDHRQNPQVIETIPKAGYRLIAEVKAESRPVNPAADDAVANKTGTSKWHSLLTNPLVLIAITIIIITSLWLPTGIDEQGALPTTESTVFPASYSIAVLPFDNISQNPAQEYFADGVTDDIITHLAKNAELVVIARDSSFFYKNSDLDIKSIADKLQVKHILNGSIRRLDEKLIINAQLVDTESGAHTWAEQYLRPVEDLLLVENEIVQSVIASLLSKQRDATSLPPVLMSSKHAQAHDYLMLGRYHFYKFANKAENTKAQTLFKEAIALDPDYALAYAILGWSYNIEAIHGWTDDRLAGLKKAEQLASKAIELQAELPLSYFVRGLSYREQGRYTEALNEVTTSLAYDPNNASARVLLATLLFDADQSELGLQRIKEAMKINPHHTYAYYCRLGQAYFSLHQYKKAVDAFQAGIDSNPAAEHLHVWLAATYALDGDIESASWEAEQVKSSNPDFLAKRIVKGERFPFKDPAKMEHFTDGLRKAGLN